MMADSSSQRRSAISLLSNKSRKSTGKMYTMPAAGAVKKPVSAPPSLMKSKLPPLGRNGLPKVNDALRKSTTPTKSVSRQSSHEPRDPIRSIKTQRVKRASPVATTPQWGSDEDDDDDEQESRRKRIRLDQHSNVDKNRKIRDREAFAIDTSPTSDIVHAADIANNETLQHGKYQYGEYFTALQEDEDECPIIRLEYPSGILKEKYQLVKPTDRSDFKPLAEIQDNMKIVAEYYLDEESGSKVSDPASFGISLVDRLQKAAKEAGRAGAQQKFIDVIAEYNRLLKQRRKDGTISKMVDEMPLVPLKLVQHIVKDQIYSRTVSPKVELVREYEGFSDNVYGELLPKFLSRIFAETHLKSNQIFVDLGSGVGNCVLQAALEIGCESWGCEMMKNPALLADAQAREFPARCQMWGIKPGKVHLIQDDFLTNEVIKDVLRRADVVLVNNQAFTPTLNDALKLFFLDLKEGCQIVSLKYFRDPLHKVKETNINDSVNSLSVVEKERFSGMVSWTDDPGKWYLHRKDSTELKAVLKRMESLY